MSLQSEPVGHVREWRTASFCTFTVSPQDGKDHPCNRPGVADLVYPHGRREARCALHAAVCEKVIAAQPGRWVGHFVAWFPR